MGSAGSLLALALAAAAATGPVPGGAAPVTVRDVVRELGLDEDDARSLRAGEIVTGRPDAASDRELVVTAAVLLPAPPDVVLAALLDDRGLDEAPDVVAWGELDGPTGAAAALDGVRFDAGEAEEVTRLLEVEAGDEMNLSAAEIARFRAVGRRFAGDDAGERRAAREAAAEVYRAVLAERFRAYRAGGIAAIAPYERDDGAASIARDLAAGAPGPTLPGRAAPDVARVFFEHGAGAGSADVVRHRFLWIKRNVEDRPTLVLAHRAAGGGPGGVVVAERHYYVGHSYDALESVTGCFPAPGGTLLVHASRTWTERVTGIGGGLRRSLGRRRAREAVVEDLDRLRRRLPR